MDSRDLIRLTVQCPDLDYPISPLFMRVAQLSADLLYEIERVQQSYEEFVVNQSLEIEVILVKMPSGKGYKKKSYVDLEKSLKEKRSFIKIIIRDQLCCARAIVTAKSRIAKHPKWNSIWTSLILCNKCYSFREKRDASYFMSYIFLACLFTIIFVYKKWNVHPAVSSCMPQV